MKKIKVDYDIILDEAEKIDRNFMLDVLCSLYGETAIEFDFAKLIDFNYNVKENMKVLAIVYRITAERSKLYEDIMKKIIFRNTTYIEKNEFNLKTEKELQNEFENDILPGTHGYGITSEMLLLYYLSKKQFKNEKMAFLKKCYLEMVVKSEDKMKVYTPDKIELNGKLKGSLMQNELNSLINEDFSKVMTEEYWENIANEYSCKYNREKKEYEHVKRGILTFIYSKLDAYKADNEYLQILLELVSKKLVKLNDFGQKQMNLLNELFSLKDENRSLKIKVKNLLKENEQLKSKHISGLSDTEKELQKSNEIKFALQLRIEKLEDHIAELEQEKQINTELKENIVIEDKMIEFKNEIPELKNIIILGGKWNSKNKSEVQEYLIDNNISFVESDKTLRYSDRIAKADLVIFDTSYNAHKYFYKIKTIAEKVYIINKSNCENIQNLFK